MNPDRAGDLVLAAHALWIAAIIVPVPLIVIGSRLGWRWVRLRWLRLAHLAMMGFVALESLLAVTCPLTAWENSLRQKAALPGYRSSFVSAWLSRLVYYDLAPAVFTTAYLLFLALIVVLYLRVPPQRRSG